MHRLTARASPSRRSLNLQQLQQLSLALQHEAQSSDLIYPESSSSCRKVSSMVWHLGSDYRPLSKLDVRPQGTTRTEERARTTRSLGALGKTGDSTP